MAGYIDIYGTIRSMAANTPATLANECYDTTIGAYQSAINQNVNHELDLRLGSITEEEFNAIFT